MSNRKLNQVLNLFVVGVVALQILACGQKQGEPEAAGQGQDSSSSQGINPSGTGTESKSLVDPCILVAKMDVAKYLGVEENALLDGVRGPDQAMLGQSECNWDLADPVEGTTIYVRRLQVVVMKDSAIDSELSKTGITAAGQYDVWYQNRDPKYAEDLSDLGEKAFIDVRFNDDFQEYLAPSVYFLKPGFMVKVTTANPVATLTQDELQVSVYAARKLAAIVDQRL